MKVSDLYNSRDFIETFGRSKTFETCRRMREVFPGFPQYSDHANEFVTAWLIYIMAKTGKTTTRESVAKAIQSGSRLKMGSELFVVWLGNALNDKRLLDTLLSIWVFEDSDFVQVNLRDQILIFQGNEKAKSVSRATHLSAQFFQDLVTKMDFSEVECSEKIFEN